MLLALDKIRLDGQTQPRIALSEDGVSCLAKALRSGAHVPPIVVSCDGESYWLVDGFHRVEAMRRVGRTEAIADVHMHEGPREAYLRALNMNAGLALSTADRKAAVDRLLSDPEWSKWSDREIGRRCGVHHETVGNLRRIASGENRQMPQPSKPERKSATVSHSSKEKETGADVIPLRPVVAESKPEPAPSQKRKYVRNGKTIEVDTTNIGKSGQSNKGKPKRLSTKAWTMLKGTSVADDKNQKRQLERLAVKMQLHVARMIQDGDAKTVKEAVDAMTGGAPVDDWGRAYQAVMQLPVDDRARLCRQVLADCQREARG